MTAACDDPKPQKIAECNLEAAKALPNDAAHRADYVRDCMRAAGYAQTQACGGYDFSVRWPDCYKAVGAWARFQEDLFGPPKKPGTGG